MTLKLLIKGDFLLDIINGSLRTDLYGELVAAAARYILATVRVARAARAGAGAARERLRGLLRGLLRGQLAAQLAHLRGAGQLRRAAG